MVDLVTDRRTTFSTPPDRLEAGTPNYSSIIAFGAAIDYLTEIGWDRIYAREGELTAQAEQLLQGLEYATVLGNPKHRAGVLSISVDGVHPYDLASFLDQYGIAVRTGSLCAQPVVNRFGLQTVTRISPAFYNTPEELEETSEIMRKVIRILRR